jgi:hypothetical protein
LSCPSAADGVWDSLLSSLSLLPVDTQPSPDLLNILHAAASSSSASSRAARGAAEQSLPAPGSAMAVAAVSALLCAGSVTTDTDSFNALISAVLYSSAVSAAAAGRGHISRSLFSACGRLPGHMRWRCGVALVTLLSGE